MKNFTLLLVLLFVVCGTAYSQKYINERGIRLKPGIYRTFEELKTNSPSIAWKYETVEKTEKVGSWDYPHQVYRISIDHNEAQQIGQVYGFCDGNKVYVSPEGPTLTSETTFQQLIIHEGQYSWFEGTYWNIGTPIHNHQSKVMWRTSRGRGMPSTYHLIDMFAGNVICVNDKNIEALLAKYPDLIGQFRAEKKGDRDYGYYVHEISKRSNQELKLAHQ
ncbi:hypothetical protein D770_15590 [Flammeovirgaceae bacterium 311]|nr:hypothetical protein D770_15590 [Flammeovirgaceae bacterium 311]